MHCGTDLEVHRVVALWPELKVPGLRDKIARCRHLGVGEEGLIVKLSV
jgi:hypothetical protein